ACPLSREAARIVPASSRTVRGVPAKPVAKTTGRREKGPGGLPFRVPRRCAPATLLNRGENRRAFDAPAGNWDLSRFRGLAAFTLATRIWRQSPPLAGPRSRQRQSPLRTKAAQ